MIELLLTVVFVLMGSQMIQGGFLRAADVFGRYSSTLKMMLWAEEQNARAREALLKDGSEGSTGGTLALDGREYSWEQTAQMLPERNLHAIRLSVAWAESGRPQTLQKEIYVYKKDLSQGP